MAKFVPRQRKHKVLARQKAKESGQHEIEVKDTNQETLPAQTQSEREDKKAQLKRDLQQNGSKISGKKAKRLEKYIENKLRKDETNELLAKLAKHRIDTSLLASSRSLGQVKESKKEAHSRALREHRAGLEGHDDIIFQQRRNPETEAKDSDLEGEETSEDEDEAPPKLLAQTSNTEVVGSGLKRPLEQDDEGRPVLKKKRKRGGLKAKISLEPVATAQEDETKYSEWHGISSDDDNEEIENNDMTARNESDGDADSDEEEEETEEEGEEEEEGGRPSAFKTWALRLRNEALGHQPSENSAGPLDIPRPDNFIPRAPEQEPLPMELQPTENDSRKAFSVTVTRLPELQEARMKLPIVSEEQRLMEGIHNNDVVVICGSTGSGKTTQIPQFLYEAGYGSPNSPTPGMIAVTQPRRVAAVSMSNRVAAELGDHSSAVAYQIRFEGTVSKETSIKFLTDGVLLRELSQDFLLSKYSAIIIDEAHERNVNTDVLIGMLSRVAKIRKEDSEKDTTIKPLKLIIMSATLKIEDLTMNPKLFPTPPPVLKVEGREHPVTVHFSRTTHSNYVEEAFKKITRGHRKLPPGGFLVFLTGQDEIRHLSKMLKTAFGGMTSAEAPRVKISATEVPMEAEDIEFGDVDDYVPDNLDLVLDDEENEQDEEFHIEEDQEVAPLKMQVLPLYSQMQTKDQLRVFEPAPKGTRQVILATNVAETSLTIPGTRFVFDCGRSKERKYDKQSGVQSFEIGFISKASANQRSGRAGRTGPGHCYRLYSSAVYERDFQSFADPEILRMPIEGIVLQLKSMGIGNVHNFPFPTPPERQSLTKAENLLTYLSALSPSREITQIGITMSQFPLAPRFAKILRVGHVHNCLPYTIAMVAGLSSPEIFLTLAQAIPQLPVNEEFKIRRKEDIVAEEEQVKVKTRFNLAHKTFCGLDDMSDAIKLLQVVGEFAHEPTEAWCEKRFVRFKVLKETQLLRKQLTELVRNSIPSLANTKFQDKLPIPTELQVGALKQIVASGFIDQVAIRADLSPTPPEQYRKPRRATEVPYVPLIPLHAIQGPEHDSLVYIHPESPLAHLSAKECPDYVVYLSLQRATPSGLDPEKKPKIRMHALTDVTGSQLSGLAKGTPLLTYGKPIKETKAPSIAGDGFATRECLVVPYLRGENTGGLGWPLPAKRVTQRKVAGKGWVVV
ncbi:putative ATP-dependent RNA helicase DHR1 [Conoideocrella luteorostrata]|uniref:RNA helicase n=1 Tax=Conoideocrella luteorostrata TaxID=1105319 RepID=A0AAJ0CL28_9HYPO|nr:putative ATP-dependent RNA helicase DHR1 [Conoideocrella luteorostrata]